MNDQRILAGSGLANIAPDVKKRGGTCTAVEDTICLAVDHATARKILQPETKTKTIEEVDEITIDSKENNLLSDSNRMLFKSKAENEIGRKIGFLKSCFDFFRVSFFLF